MTRSSLLPIALLLIVSLAGTVRAADEAPPPPDAASDKNEQADLATDAQELLSTIAERRAQAQEVKRERESATGEDQALFVIRVLQIEDELRDALDKALVNLKEQREAQLETAELEARLEDDVVKHGKTLRSEIARVQKLLEEIGARRESTEPEQLLTLEQQIAKYNGVLDTLVNHFQENIDRAKTLEIGTAADLKYLDELLSERAKRLKGQILLTQEQISDSEEQLKIALEDQKPPIQARINAYKERLSGLSKSLSTIVKSMEVRELDTAEYNQLLIETTGEITVKVLDRRVAAGIVQQWLKRLGDWVIDNGPGIVVKAIVIVSILFVFKLLGNIAGRVVARGIATSKLALSKLLQDFFVNIASKAVVFLGVLIALSQLGIELGPLLAGLGVAGFIVGFALQDTLSNFASGMMILVYRPYDVGDVIEAGGVMGKVSQMSLVSTTVLTFDNQKLVVPNNKIWGDVIRNVTSQEVRRIDMTFGIGYGDDIAHAERVLNDIVKKDERVLDDPAAVVRLHTLGESSVDFIVRPWVKTSDYWDVYWDVTRKVKERFDAEGISIPFPQRDVHLFQETAKA